jgi:uncharacterized protein YrrD
MLNLDIIREKVHGVFRPFTLHLRDGRKFPVPHQDFILVGKNMVIVNNEHDVAQYIDALHIVSLEESGHSMSA